MAYTPFRAITGDHFGGYRVSIQRKGKTGSFRVLSYASMTDTLEQVIACKVFGRNEEARMIAAAYYVQERSRLAELNNKKILATA